MWRRWKAGQGKLCFVSCSHQRASAGKYLFPQTQQGLQFVQLSARTQNDGPRLLAQKLPERDNQPRIIDGPERVRNITSLFRCFTVMSDRSDHPSVPTYLRRPSCFSVRLERRFSVPACNLTERWSQRRSREARSRAEPRAAASLRRALDLDGPLRPAQRLIRLGASELPLPLPTIPTARREAEAGSPSKSVTTTPSIAVILLSGKAEQALTRPVTHLLDGRARQAHVEEIEHQRGEAIQRHELKGREIDDDGGDPIAILHRRADPLGKRALGHRTAGRATAAMGAVLGHHKWFRLRQIKDLTGVVIAAGCLRQWLSAVRATCGKVIDGVVGFVDRTEGSSGVALLPAGWFF